MLRRPTYFLVLLVWLLLMALPILAIVLAASGELMIGHDEGSNLRLFTVTEDEVQGIGVQRVKKVGTDSSCLRTSIRYLLWEGHSDEFNTVFCTCYDLETGYVDPNRSCDSSLQK